MRACLLSSSFSPSNASIIFVRAEFVNDPTVQKHLADLTAALGSVFIPTNEEYIAAMKQIEDLIGSLFTLTPTKDALVGFVVAHYLASFRRSEGCADSLAEPVETSAEH